VFTSIGAAGASDAPVAGSMASRWLLAWDTVSSRLKLRSMLQAPLRPYAVALPIEMSVLPSWKIRVPKEPPAKAPTSHRPASWAAAGHARNPAPARRAAASLQALPEA